MSEMDIHDATVDETEVEGAETDLEAPEADAIEQHQVVGPDAGRWTLDHVPFDADEADAAEQSRIVALDEDDYR